MAEAEEKGFDDFPIITYGNHIQKHMFKLTEELSYDNTISLTEKRKLRLIIANLPPKAKELLKDIYDKCESKAIITTDEFDKMYSKVSDWIYDNILQSAFAAKPKYTKKGTL